MRADEEALLRELTDLACAIEPGLVLQVAERLSGLAAGPPAEELRRIAVDILPAEPRAAFARVLDRWAREHADLSGVAVAWALRAAATVSKHHREAQQVQLVWTGPAMPQATLRSTDQALLELVRDAQHSILIVSFAAYRVPVVHDALLEAANRGVTITFVFESERESDGRITFDPARALDAALAEKSAVYVWPCDQRAQHRNDYGQVTTGLLHAKCAVADERVLLVSSANLTENALWLNMELGVLLRGGEHPRGVARHFGELIGRGVLVRAPRSDGDE